MAKDLSIGSRYLLKNLIQTLAGFEQVAVLASHYERCAYGEFYAMAGSSGYIEIVLREANAASKLGVAAGAPVELMGWANA